MIEYDGQLFRSISDMMDYTQKKAAAKAEVSKLDKKAGQPDFQFCLSSGHCITETELDDLFNTTADICLSNGTQIAITHVATGLPENERYFIFQHQCSEEQASVFDVRADGILYESPRFPELSSLQSHLNGYLQGLYTASKVLIMGMPGAKKPPMPSESCPLGFVLTEDGHSWSMEGLEEAAAAISHLRKYSGKCSTGIFWQMGSVLNDPKYLAWLLRERPAPQIVLETPGCNAVLTTDDGYVAKLAAETLDKEPFGSSYDILRAAFDAAFNGKKADDATACLASGMMRSAEKAKDAASEKWKWPRPYLEFGNRRRFACESAVHRTAYTNGSYAEDGKA